jgi:nitrate reductase NapD
MLLPGREEEVIAKLASMAGVETGAFQNRKLVILLEGPDSGAVGGLLAQIAVMDGVISANMVFEHTETTKL